MQQFVRNWITNNTFQSVNINQFDEYLKSHVNDSVYEKVNPAIWVMNPGLAPFPLDFTTPAMTESQDLADEYIILAGTASPSNYTDYNDFYSSLKVVFLERLNSQEDQMTIDIMEKIDVDLNVT